jgi:hypothetical protein
VRFELLEGAERIAFAAEIVVDGGRPSDCAEHAMPRDHIACELERSRDAAIESLRRIVARAHAGEREAQDRATASDAARGRAPVSACG